MRDRRGPAVQVDIRALARFAPRQEEDPMSERFVTRGFVGRRGDRAGGADVASRIPPGQYLTTDFPVLSAGPTPRTPLDRWSLSIEGLVRAPVRWTWAEFLALPA